MQVSFASWVIPAGGSGLGLDIQHDFTTLQPLYVSFLSFAIVSTASHLLKSALMAATLCSAEGCVVSVQSLKSRLVTLSVSVLSSGWIS